MNNLIIPPSPNWYENRILACSVDNTIVYGALSDIIVINPIGEDKEADVKTFPPAHYAKVLSVDVNLNWSPGNKLVVSAGEDKFVHLWNADNYTLQSTNNSHTSQPDKLIGSVFMGLDKIVSASETGFISLWRFKSGEINTFKSLFGFKCRITTLSACPHVTWMMAFGLNCGLVVIADLRKAGRVIYKLRGHDKSVVSLSWCPTPFNIFPKKVPISQRLSSGLDWRVKDKVVSEMEGDKESELEIKVEGFKNDELGKDLREDSGIVEGDEVNKDVNEINKDINDINKDVNQINKDINEINNDINESYKDINESNKDINESNKDETNKINIQFSNDHDILNKDVDENNKEKDSPNKEIKDSNKDLNKSSKDIDEDNKEKNSINKESKDLDSLNKEINENDKQIDDNIKTNEPKKEIDEFCDNLDTSNKDIDKDNKKEDSINKESEEFKQDLDTTNKEIHKDEKQINKEIHKDQKQTHEFNEIDELNTKTESSIKNIKPSSLNEDQNTEISEIQSPTKEYLLASSSKGGTICIWRAGTDGRKQTEMFVKASKSRNWRNDKSSWISLCWITPDILLSSSTSAELLQWNLLKPMNKGLEKKLIHHDHNNNLFAIAAPIVLIPEWKNEIKRQCLFAWTFGQERYLLNTSLQADRAIIASYPTVGGHVYTIRSSPLDPSRLAIGIGDNTAKVWDLSRPHKQCITMANLWQKIQSKVLALAWHPQKETILAYATAEGRIGTVNTSSKKSNLLCQYFRNPVYDIQWGPIDSNLENLGLYAIGEGKLVVYNTSKENEDPKLIDSSVKEYKQCLAWKSDFSLLACGTKTGSIIIYNTSLNHLTTIYSEYKSIYNVVWHPLATAQDEGTSPMSSWLVISSSCTSVVVFDIKTDEQDDKKVEPIVLSRHTKPVRCVSWSPYVGGMLISGGDDGVIHVWDVKTKSILATYIGHNLEPVFTVLWSPLDENFIISGGRDNFIRVWNINEHKPKSNQEIRTALEPYATFRHESRKNKKTEEDEDTIKIQRGLMLNLCYKAQNSPKFVLNDCLRLFKKLNPNDQIDIEIEDDTTNSFDVLKIFEDKDSMIDVLNVECKNHQDKKKYFQSQHIELWKGDITETLNNAISEGNVTPWLISLAPMVSIDLWKKACETYVKKLMEDAKSDPIETASYLLMCHKVEEAIEVLCNATLFREALALAKCRLSKKDPVINDILKKWATFGVLQGTYEVSTQCFIVLEQYEEAAKVLFKRTDLDALKFSVILAEKSGNKDLIDACTARFNMFKNAGAGDEGQSGEVEKIEKGEVNEQGDLLDGDELIKEEEISTSN